jgi:hypothetical protein
MAIEPAFPASADTRARSAALSCDWQNSAASSPRPRSRRRIGSPGRISSGRAVRASPSSISATCSARAAAGSAHGAAAAQSGCPTPKAVTRIRIADLCQSVRLKASATAGGPRKAWLTDAARRWEGAPRARPLQLIAVTAQRARAAQPLAETPGAVDVPWCGRRLPRPTPGPQGARAGRDPVAVGPSRSCCLPPRHRRRPRRRAESQA